MSEQISRLYIDPELSPIEARDEDGRVIVVCEPQKSDGSIIEQHTAASARMAFIVRAVNCHADLVAALEASNKLITDAQEKLCAYLHPDSGIDDNQIANSMLEHFDGPRQRDVQKKTRAALAKARGGSSDV